MQAHSIIELYMVSGLLQQLRDPSTNLQNPVCNTCFLFQEQYIDTMRAVNISLIIICWSSSYRWDPHTQR